MAQYNATLASMAARVSGYKPNSVKTQIYRDINARIRQICDYCNWSALITRGAISIPAAYGTGSVSIASGSTTVTGTSTAWPVSDIVNTTLTAANRNIGYQEVTPASMAGISVDTNIYIPDSTYSEVVPVVETTSSTFIGNFKYQHNNGVSATSSSLAGLQLKLGQYQPVYTLLAVTGSGAGIIDMPLAGASVSNSAYWLVKAYLTIDPDLKDILDIWDPMQGVPLEPHLSQSFLAQADPQRTASGNPTGLADLSPSAAGAMQHEIWPHQLAAYSLPLLYVKQWPELKQPTDRPPWFIDPGVIEAGATADALRRKDLRNAQNADPYYDPMLAREFEAKFAEGVMRAASADEGKRIRSLTMDWRGLGGGPNAAYQQSHIGYWDD